MTQSREILGLYLNLWMEVQLPFYGHEIFLAQGQSGKKTIRKVPRTSKHNVPETIRYASQQTDTATQHYRGDFASQEWQLVLNSPDM